MTKRTAAACIGLAAISITFALPAHADVIYDFSINANQGSAPGTITGTLDLAFVSAGGSGSGAATSLVLTSVSSGIQPFFNVNPDVTGGFWNEQVTNTFTVTNGVVTSFEFMSLTDHGAAFADVFCMNSTSGSAGTFQVWICPAGLNGLTVNRLEAYNTLGWSGVTFTPEASVPEPATLSLLGLGLAGVGLMRRRKAA